ncbi:signal transduction histidine kinase [Streptomyces sp. SAI-208]|uniref:sensor histidine kinase n=1 Tax=Streptomyces sp. SAI-208 TaxID=2940550 RepID=UPI0024764B0F|nr:ATP-binding protein [Streptomyces sp. SAI-208]MDH6604749.1 signal transduction histidine kinase [Streptomyces sp. SAI-208]
MFPVVLLVAAGGAAAAAVSAPEAARSWVLAMAVAAWCCIAVVTATASYLLRRARRQAAARDSELGMTKDHWKQQGTEVVQLLNVGMPGVAQQLKNGASAEEAVSRVTTPSDPQLRQILDTFAAQLGASMARATTAENELRTMRSELANGRAELERLTEETLPAAVALLREGSSGNTVLTKFDWPQNPLVRETAEWFVRELAYSERRSAAAQVASAKALSRVQSKTVAMLADLREMQERHGQEVFGDLLRLDHSTSQLGLMTDRLALLMGGRSSRVWNKPIVMESILRGAVGRIAAYRRVRLHSSSKAAIAGFAAEGVMHLLAELMDNAANFSPPIDEVHVYVEERSAGLVVTIEDSGLKMSDAAMRRAEESVSGRVTDLASLQGTRLGLTVVGRLAERYGISVNYRPSSRGGTGVVVLLPPQLLSQQREPVVERPRPAAEAPAASAPAVEAEQTPVPRTRPAAPVEPVAPAAGADAPADRGTAPGNALPVRAPGRTMAAAERARQKATPAPADEPVEPAPARDAGSRFGAFHRARHGGGVPDDSVSPPDDGPESAAE